MPVGSGHPIVVQSMTNTDTADVAATVRQVAALARAGSELVRVTVNNEEAAAAVPAIVRAARPDRASPCPIIGDFHYNGHLLLTKYPDCARALAKYRINPGNVGGKRRDENFRAIIEIAIANDKPVRIGVNWGSLDQNLLTEMMDANARRPDPLDAQDVTMEAMVESALQIGRPRRGGGAWRTTASSSAPRCRACRIWSTSIGGSRRGATIRCTSASPRRVSAPRASSPAPPASASCCRKASATPSACRSRPRPGGDRTEEVQVAQQILQSLGLRSFTPQVTSCPGLRADHQHVLPGDGAGHPGLPPRADARVALERPGVEEMKVAVMGCVVNGPGESKHANIGISLPGTFEEPKAPVYVDGRLMVTLKGDGIVPEFLAILERYVASRYAVRPTAADGVAEAALPR